MTNNSKPRSFTDSASQVFCAKWKLRKPRASSCRWLSFNLGVEVGQIAVAAVILPLFWYFRKKPEFTLRWIPACSVLVAAAGAFWFVQRVWF